MHSNRLKCAPLAIGLLVATLLACGPLCSAQIIDANSVIPLPETDSLAALQPSHPRLLMSEADWKALAEKQQNDPELARVIARIETDAKWLLQQPPLVYEKKGKRLLDVSRQAVQRILQIRANHTKTTVH